MELSGSEEEIEGAAEGRRIVESSLEHPEGVDMSSDTSRGTFEDLIQDFPPILEGMLETIRDPKILSEFQETQ